MPNALTDLGNASRFVKRYGDIVRYCWPQHQWYIWDGYRWVSDNTGRIMELAKLTVATMKDESVAEYTTSKELALWERHVKNSESLRSLNAMVELAQTEPNISIGTDALDTDPWFFNCINGTIDLRTGELEDHRRDRIITKMANFEFNPGADSSLWVKFLESSVPDADLREFLQCAVGYSLTTDMREEVMFFIHGSGQSGKSTFVNSILNMMGDYGAQTSASTWLVKRSEGPRNDLIRLIGRRFVAASETSMECTFDEELLKAVTGVDHITVNPKYKDEIEIIPTWKIWMNANHRPAIKETEMAIWRRIRLIPFNTVVEVRDPVLKIRLTTDPSQWSAIFNWALEGCLKWQGYGALHTPKVVQAAVAQYRREQDVIGQFLDDCCMFSLSAKIPKADLYHSFELYARAGGEKQVPRIIRFGNELTRRAADRVYDRKYNNQWHWYGIKLSEKVSIHPEDYYSPPEGSAP